MFYQGRGNVYLAKVSEGVLIEAYKRKICPDAFSIELTTDSFEHINKCGAVDVPDYRGTKASSGKVTLSFANVEDKNYALAVLGTKVAGSTGTITNEVIPAGIEVDDFWFLGGLERHRTITGLVIHGDGSPTGPTLVLGTDYTLDDDDADSGLVTFLTAQPGGATATYTYDDPDYVSMLTSAQDEWAVMFEHINKANSNDPGGVELYRVRFDPATNMDYLSEELQIPQLVGSALADVTKLSDGDLGQFGRRVL